MLFSAVSDEALHIIRSEATLIAAPAAMAMVVVGAVASRRALEPTLPWRTALLRGAHEQAQEVRASFRLLRRARPADQVARHTEDASLQGARRAVALVASAVMGLVGALALALSGHAPSPAMVLAPAGIAATVALVTALRIARPAETRSIIARRWARLLTSSAFSEASSAVALIIVIAVVLATAGLSAVGVIEIAAITLATRLAIRMTPWPGGLGVADVVLVVPLLWIGVPLEVAAAAILIWRSGSVLATTAAVVVARHARADAGGCARPPVSDWGRPLHRGAFAVVGLLPGRLREAIRRRVFDAMFTLSDDPWGYQSTDYEQRKRRHLLAAVGHDPTVVLEVGSADGHNLAALARQLPDAVIVGTDISREAVAVARERTRELGNVTVVHTDERDRIAPALAGGVDCVVLAEVLYYLGWGKAMRSALGPVRELLRPESRIVFIHGSTDGERLHQAAARAMGLSLLSTEAVDDPERPFVVSVATYRG